jgi:hypothetical protein
MTAGAAARVLSIVAAAGFAGCGGSLAWPGAPGVPPADGGAAEAGARGIGPFSPGTDAALTPPDGVAFDGPGVNLCPEKVAERVAGTTCQFLIPDAAVCTGIGIRVRVLIDGAEVPQLWPPATDGWTYTDASETAIELHGAACERAGQPPTAVTIWFTFFLA